MSTSGDSSGEEPQEDVEKYFSTERKRNRREIDEPLYCLMILMRGSGGEVKIWGTRHDLKKAFDSYTEEAFGKRIVVSGHMNTADRASISVALEAEEVAGMVFFLEN